MLGQIMSSGGVLPWLSCHVRPAGLFHRWCLARRVFPGKHPLQDQRDAFQCLGTCLAGQLIVKCTTSSDELTFMNQLHAHIVSIVCLPVTNHIVGHIAHTHSARYFSTATTRRFQRSWSIRHSCRPPAVLLACCTSTDVCPILCQPGLVRTGTTSSRCKVGSLEHRRSRSR